MRDRAGAQDHVVSDGVGVRAPAHVPSNVELLRLAFENFNEVCRTDGDLLEFVRNYFHSHAEYRPIEDRDWFRDPDAIATSLRRWLETWAPGSYSVEPEEILEFDDDRIVVTFRTRGVGRGSGVPIEAVTAIACVWRGGKFAFFDEYSDTAGALAAIGEPAEPIAGPKHDQQPTFADRLLAVGESAFGSFVRRRNDRQLARLFSAHRAQRALFKRMEQVFEPARAGGFRGEIEYELLCPDGPRRWAVQIDGSRAVARAGDAPAAAVALSMPLPLFIRIAARQVHPARAFRNGWLEVRGDFETAARIGVMFGLSR
jgi:hypothetical protein